MTARTETKTLIARQCATFVGQDFNKLDAKKQAAWKTLAERILATVERKMQQQHGALHNSMQVAGWWDT